MYEPDDPEVAPNALLEKQPSEIKSQQLHLVQFFDQRSLWSASRSLIHFPTSANPFISGAGSNLASFGCLEKTTVSLGR